MSTFDSESYLCVENENMRLVFDRHSAAVVSFENLVTGWRIHRRAECRCGFRMHLPLADRRNNQAVGIAQPVAPEVKTSDSQLEFYWPELASEHGGVHSIGLRLSVALSGEGIEFNTQIQNDSELTVESLAWPNLGDLSPVDDETPLWRWWTGYASANQSQLFPVFMGEKGQWGVDGNVSNAINNHDSLFALVGTLDQGLYMGFHDHTLQHMVSLYFEDLPGYKDYYHFTREHRDTLGNATVHMNMYTVHFCFLGAGQRADLTPVFWQVYNGTWHKGVDIYKAWKQSWFRPASYPAWVMQVHAWHQYQVSGAEDDLRLPFSGLVELAREAASHGIKAIQLVGWNDGGQDRGNPFHDHDPRLGTREALQQAISEAAKLGVKIILFSKFTWMDQSLEWFENEGQRYATRDPYGHYHVNSGCQYQTFSQLSDLNTRRMIPVCNHCEAWRDFAGREVEKLLDYGTEGMLYDELMHHGAGTHCYSKDHGHAVPVHNFAADSLLAQRFQDVTRERMPGFLMAAEDPHEVHLPYYHLTYFRFAHWSNMHFTRYINPWHPMMAGVFGYDDRNMINKCLQYRYIISYEPRNFKGRLCEAPLTVEYGKKVDALRERLQPELWDAEFRDAQGASVTAKGKVFDPLDFSVFVRPEGKRAVVVCNVDDENGSEISVAFDQPAKSPAIRVATPEAPAPADYSGHVWLPARSACVVYEA